MPRSAELLYALQGQLECLKVSVSPDDGTDRHRWAGRRRGCAAEGSAVRL